MRTTGKVWVVTGAGAGMGRELVRQLLGRGARVAAVDMRADGLTQTAGLAGAGDRVSTHVVDVTDRAATEALPGAVERAHGTVDGLINNAGIIQPFQPVQDLGWDVIHRVLDVNLVGTLHMVKAFLPVLLERPEAHIANVSSMGGFFPFPGQTVYGASKAGVKLLTEGLYAELLDGPVRVSVIMPGAVQTDITANSGVVMAAAPEGASRVRMMTPEDAARIMLDGIEKDRYHIYVGRDALLMGLAVRIAPRRATRFVQRRMKGLLAPATTANAG